jgi:D-sedoheptulose 7-phosphate isomerase
VSDRTAGGHVTAQRTAAVEDWRRLADALSEPALVAAVDAAGQALIEALDAGRRLIVVGNGGSAAMSSHVAAEFAGKCVLDREPLPALALSDSSTAITAIGNDYGFEHVFSRGVRAHGGRGDVLLAMTTSGRSPNIVGALDTGRELGLVTIAMTGSGGALLTDRVDHLLVVPSDYTPRIQEVHLLWAHAWCEAVDLAWNA